MIWVGWREQRTETLIAAGIVAVVALLLVPTGIQMANAYHHDGIGACLSHPGFGCDDTIHSFQNRFQSMNNFLGWLTLLPGLVGVLLAAPLIVQLENGSYRLDWTQSITRGRWLSGKLGLAVGAAVALAVGFIVLVTWWHAPLVHINGRMENSVFDSEGVVPIGYTLYALGLALAVGVLWRRAVAALVIGFVGYFASRLFVDLWLRQRLTPPESATWSAIKGNGPASMNHAWVISEQPSDKYGHTITPHIGACPSGDLKACFVAHAPRYMHAVYEPASRFWQMQLVELALFTGTAVALIGFAAWWVLRRD